MFLPICFSNPNAASPQTPQKLTTCTFQAQFFDTPVLLMLTWSKTLFTHSLTIQAAELFCITISLYPSRFSLFGNRPGSKTITQRDQDHRRIKVYWDFTRAVFTRDSAEPESLYYIAITCNGKLEFFLGDRRGFVTKGNGKSMNCRVAEPAQLSKREHLFARRTFKTTAKFNGNTHDIELECTGGVLRLKVDGEASLVVKRLAWKFRGNERILIAGMWVDFFWDVFNWVSTDSGRCNSYGVFGFQVGDGGIFPEMVGQEKKFLRKSLSASTTPVMLSPSPSCSSVLQWAEENSDCGKSSCSGGSGGVGFSLVLYAWRRD
ncbi:hypothetical protein Droror1_Dr00023023 [Drosera rotundifolia]